MKTYLLTITSALVLLACSPREETRTVDYYKEHKEELAAKRKECTDNPGELGKTTNCINAERADAQLSLGSSK